MADGFGDDAERVLAAAQAERDLFRLGATPECVALVDEIARRLRRNSFTALDVIRAAAAEQSSSAIEDLRFALVAALGSKANSARALGRLLGKFRGLWVIQESVGKDSEGATWALRWPRRVWPLGEFGAPETHPGCRGDAADGGL